MSFDLSGITIAQVIIVTLVLTFLDFIGGVLPAVISRTFSAALVAAFLETHVLKRVFPIVGLLLISTSLGATTSAGQAVWALAILGVATYLAETVKSLSASLPSPSAARTDDSA